MSPQRIQLRRTKGWRKPEGAIVVARPSRWGNPYIVERAREVGATGLTYAGPWQVKHTRHGLTTGAAWGGFGDDKTGATEFAVGMFRRAIIAMFEDLDGAINREHYIGKLRGHDLACWCPLDQPCHADVLLELANKEVAA